MNTNKNTNSNSSVSSVSSIAQLAAAERPSLSSSDRKWLADREQYVGRPSAIRAAHSLGLLSTLGEDGKRYFQ